MGSPVKLCDEYEDEQDRQEKYADILAQYPQVQDQGDGMKSFVGILLQLMLDYICVYLIDEPESFLHPPQARIMGEIIGETLSNQQQAFISTHSEDIIKGLLDVAPKRLKIIRITREGNTNSFAVLDNDNLRKLWADPLLKYSNIMSAIFHKNVVLCESDSDYKMYSLVDEALKQEQNRYSETLFVHCGGKQRMAKVVLALRSLEIDVKLIPDLDVLNDEATFKGITDSFAIDWNLIQGKYRIICSDIGNKHKNVNRESAKVDIDRILDSSSSEYLTSSEIERIRSVIKTESGWKAIKEYGVSALLTKLRIAATHMVYWRKNKGGDVGMMTRRDGVQQKMLCVTLESLMPQEHFLRRLDSLMDFSFIYQRVESLYSHRGRRPSTLLSLSRCSCSVICTA